MKLHTLKDLELVVIPVARKRTKINRLVKILTLFKDPETESSKKLTLDEILERLNGVSLYNLRKYIQDLRSIGLLSGKYGKDRQYFYYLSLNGYREFTRRMVESVNSLFFNGIGQEGV